MEIEGLDFKVTLDAREIKKESVCQVRVDGILSFLCSDKPVTVTDIDKQKTATMGNFESAAFKIGMATCLKVLAADLPATIDLSVLEGKLTNKE